MRPKSKAAYLEVPAHFTERGNILLMNEYNAGMNAWIALDVERVTHETSQWIEISLRPEDYPSLAVNVVHIKERELARHINTEFAGEEWFVRKMNIDGVCIENNHVSLDWSFADLTAEQVEIVKMLFLTDELTQRRQRQRPLDSELLEYFAHNREKVTMLIEKARDGSEEDHYTEVLLYTFKGDQIGFKKWLELGEPPVHTVVYATEGKEFQDYTYSWGKRVKNDMPIGIEPEDGEGIQLFDHILVGTTTRK